MRNSEDDSCYSNASCVVVSFVDFYTAESGALIAWRRYFIWQYVERFRFTALSSSQVTSWPFAERPVFGNAVTRLFNLVSRLRIGLSGLGLLNIERHSRVARTRAPNSEHWLSCPD